VDAEVERKLFTPAATSSAALDINGRKWLYGGITRLDDVIRAMKIAYKAWFQNKPASFLNSQYAEARTSEAFADKNSLQFHRGRILGAN